LIRFLWNFTVHPIFDNAFYIYFDMMEFSLEEFIFGSETLEVILEHERHRIEKKRYIEYCVHHREYFSCHRVRYEIPESDRRRRDNCEIKRIEIAPALSLFEPMYQNSSDEPTDKKNNSDNDEFLMNDMETGHM